MLIFPPLCTASLSTLTTSTLLRYIAGLFVSLIVFITSVILSGFIRNTPLGIKIFSTEAGDYAIVSIDEYKDDADAQWYSWYCKDKNDKACYIRLRTYPDYVKTNNAELYVDYLDRTYDYKIRAN
jgi:hypothetical protein